MKIINLSVTALIFLFTLAVVSFFSLQSTIHGQTPTITLPPHLNVIEGTTGQDSLFGTEGDDLFILYGAGRWNWDHVFGNGGTNYVQMPASIDTYISARSFEWGGYLFDTNSSSNLGTVWAADQIHYLVFPEGIFTLEDAVMVINE